jgi:hypothetical protein
VPYPASLSIDTIDTSRQEEEAVQVGRWILVGLVTSAVVVGLAAPGIAATPPQLKVRLIEYKVRPARDFVAKGKTSIVAKNAGSDKHEIVIVRGDDPTALPTKPDGSVNESKIPKARVVGEIEGIKPGKAATKVFKLAPGSYVLFCNIVDKTSTGEVSHFAQGMYTTLEAS